jgi:Flp pilus assembly protein TadD
LKPTGTGASTVSAVVARLATVCSVLAIAACNMPGTPEHEHEQSLMEFQADADHVNIADAQADFTAGHYISARDRFARLVAGDPTNMKAKLGLAESLLALNDYTNALGAFKLLGDDPAYRAASLQGQGLALMALGQVDAAGAVLLEAAKADPGSWRSWNALGQYYDAKQQWAFARTSYDNALAASSAGAPVVLNNVGMSLMLQKKYAEAGSRFEAALKIEPGLVAARNNLRLALSWQGRYEDAAANPGRDEVASILNNVGYIALLRGDYVQARIYLLKATEVSPSFNKIAWDNLRLLEAMSGRRGMAPAVSGTGLVPAGVAPGQ